MTVFLPGWADRRFIRARIRTGANPSQAGMDPSRVRIESWRIIIDPAPPANESGQHVVKTGGVTVKSAPADIAIGATGD